MLMRGAEENPRDRDGPQKLVEIGLGRVDHLGVGLGAEVLDDDFLDVPEFLVDIPDG